MMCLLAIPLGIIFGFIIDKAYLKNQTLGFIVTLMPYFIFYLLSSEDIEKWNYLRSIAFLSTLIAVIYYTIVNNLREKSKVS